MVLRTFAAYLSSSAKTVLQNMTKPNVVFVLGGPGAGKGTQCEKIVEVCTKQVKDCQNLNMHK